LARNFDDVAYPDGLAVPRVLADIVTEAGVGRVLKVRHGKCNRSEGNRRQFDRRQEVS
jgi:hypothetical protein